MRCGRYYAPGEGTGGTTHGVGWGARNYHNGNGVGPPKRAGEQTDYGDYSLLLAEHLAATADSAPSAMDLAALLPRWRKAMSSWRSWMCTQTKQALQKLAALPGWARYLGWGGAWRRRLRKVCAR